MLTVTCAEWCGLTEPRFRFTPLLAFMTVKDVEDADLPRFCRSRSTLVEQTLGLQKEPERKSITTRYVSSHLKQTTYYH